jgi:hypothetical protein
MTRLTPANGFSPGETLNSSQPFGLSLSKPSLLQGMPFDKLRANGDYSEFPSQEAIKGDLRRFSRAGDVFSC